jgi:hypothetical protein
MSRNESGFAIEMRDVGHDMRTLRDGELDAVSGGWSRGSGPSGAGHLTVPVVARRSLLETMADDSCNI